MSLTPCLADVLLPLPLKKRFTYNVPEKWHKSVRVGQWVVVPFGYRRTTHGIILSIHNSIPCGFSLKDISEIITKKPLIPAKNFAFWQWMAQYYMTSKGSVFHMALPEKMYTVYHKVSKNAYEKCLKLDPNIDKNKLDHIITQLKNARQQKRVLFKYLEIEDYTSGKKLSGVSKKDLINLSNVSPGVLKGLLQKKILIEFDREIKKITSSVRLPALSKTEKKIYGQLEDQFNRKEVVLFQGTNEDQDMLLVFHLIKKQLEDKKSVLFLHSEIQDLKKMEKTLTANFGERVISYYGQLKLSLKAGIWKKVRKESDSCIYLGIKSSLFLPFRNLGLVIIYNDHTALHKQREKSPYFHTRDAAIMLADFTKAKTLLYDSTPSFESCYNAAKNKYGRLKTNFREDRVSPIEIIDISEPKRKKIMKGDFAPRTIEYLEKILIQQKKTVIFKNRRGFANYFLCKHCKYVPVCLYCDVSLTYHQEEQNLQCHYCNYTQQLSTACPKCKRGQLVCRGSGTRSVVNQIRSLFPDCSVSYLDTDLSKQKQQQIIRAFNDEDVKILISTQLGLYYVNYEQVSCFVMLDVDEMLNFPDFRAEEKCLQQILQISSHLKEDSKFLIQTYDFAKKLFAYAITYNYDGFFKYKIVERKNFVYPPFYRLIDIELKDKDLNTVTNATKQLVQSLKLKLGIRIFGPQSPVIGRKRTYFIKKVMVKIEPNNQRRKKIKEIILETTNEIMKNIDYKSVRINFDVDPQ